jgi:hypothetical protein
MLTTLPPSRAVVMTSGNLNLLEPSGPLQACNGADCFTLLLNTTKRASFLSATCMKCRSLWPGGQRRGSAGARLLGLRVRIPSGAWMSVSCECCVSPGRGFCDGPITRPEESYRVCVCVCVCVCVNLTRVA